jgi:trk system potassium uptake protein TrkH|tara:strand:+ start:16885 stop:18306 length:1422 start_codon:yes stop_codon:yes gene_type:complete
MVGGLAVCSGLIDLLGSGSDSPTLLITGSGMGLLGSLLLGRVRGPGRTRPVDIIVATTLTLTLGILLVAGLYLMTGATQRPDDALFEATTGITTTAMSVLDPAGLGYGLRFLRAGSQWLGGFAALLVGIVILPFFGFGGEFADRSRSGGYRPLAPDEASATRNILRLYVPGTGLIWGGYTLAGKSWFDGLLLAMSTVSTGGFTSGADEFADPSVQWVAIGGMLLAGSSMVTFWHLFVGRGGLHRQTGLSMYLGLNAAGVLLLVLWSTGVDLAAARRLLFVVAASVSTTGFPMDVPSEWSTAAPVLLLLLVSVGAMSGSAGGGLQIRQHRALMKMALREMARQLHPRAVLKVRLDRRVAGEDTLRQIVVLQFLFVAVTFSTAFVVAVFGLDLAASISAAVHATATAGPVRGLDGVMVDPTEWPRSVRLALLPAMVFGRLSIYPAVVAVVSLLSLLRDKARVSRRYRAHRHGGSL